MSLSQEEVIKEYIYQMKDIYDKLLTFIDNPDSRSEKYFQNLIHINKKHDIKGDKERFSNFIDLLVNISNDHHRQSGFFDKIERILSQYKDTIKANSTNIEIFEQFSSNKRLLYFLIKSGILIIDDNVGPIIEYKIEKNGIRYSDYFLFEIPKNDNNRVNDNEQLKYYMNHFDEYEENRKNAILKTIELLNKKIDNGTRLYLLSILLQILIVLYEELSTKKLPVNIGFKKFKNKFK